MPASSRILSGSCPGPNPGCDEVGYLLENRVGPETEVRFPGDLAASNLLPEGLRRAIGVRIAELVATYSDLALGTVDASVVVAAERLGAVAVATLDLTHFSVVRSAHASALELLP